MHEATKRFWYRLREHATHWVIGGILLALTGFAPEEWFAHTVRDLHIPENVLHLWAAGIDVRVVPIAIGVIAVAIGLLQQRRNAPSAPAGGHHSMQLMSEALLPTDGGGADKATLAQRHLEAPPLPDLSRNRLLFVIARNSSLPTNGAHRYKTGRTGARRALRA